MHDTGTCRSILTSTPSSYSFFSFFAAWLGLPKSGLGLVLTPTPQDWTAVGPYYWVNAKDRTGPAAGPHHRSSPGPRLGLDQDRNKMDSILHYTASSVLDLAAWLSFPFLKSLNGSASFSCSWTQSLSPSVEPLLGGIKVNLWSMIWTRWPCPSTTDLGRPSSDSEDYSEHHHLFNRAHCRVPSLTLAGLSGSSNWFNENYWLALLRTAMNYASRIRRCSVMSYMCRRGAWALARMIDLAWACSDFILLKNAVQSWSSTYLG